MIRKWSSKRNLIIGCVGTFMIGLLVMLPARVIYQFAAPSGLNVSGISGSAWAGAAEELSVNGAYLRNLKWRIKPLHLLSGKARYHIEADPAPGFVETDVTVGFGGRIEITSLRAAVSIERFSLQYRLLGTANLSFERIRIEDDFVVAVDGTLEARNLSIPSISRSPLGNFKADFFTQDDGFAASIEDTDATVDFAGSLQVSNDHSFEFLGQIIETPATAADVRQQLQFLPPADARGQRELRLEGSL
jgi:general secretion pathway protein N